MQNIYHHPGLLADGSAIVLDFLRLVGLAILAVMIQGYHPGLEDDTFYLAAIRKDLNPALFPYDGDFFTLQFQATIMLKLIGTTY
jgi:hypothetical protein